MDGGSQTTARQTFDQNGRAVGRRGLQTRQRLLEATAELLREQGMRDLRVVDVARAVGTSPATFYQYFKDVREAILRLSEQAAEEMPDIVNLIDGPWRGQSGLKTARAVVDAVIRHWDTHEAVLRVRNLSADEGDPRFRRVVRDALSPLVDRLSAEIRRAQGAGRVSPDVSAAAAAASLVAMLERMASYHAQLENRGVTHSKLVETCARILFQTVTGRSAP
ncbi:MAG: TetR/AcrR family transcriptional regulator [Deltaproteobacteria bacterium]|nr:MAG: TetR/AcrR family transcriptional regulator [Deltaproteobacteria bacterium]